MSKELEANGLPKSPLDTLCETETMSSILAMAQQSYTPDMWHHFVFVYNHMIDVRHLSLEKIE